MYNDVALVKRRLLDRRIPELAVLEAGTMLMSFFQVDKLVHVIGDVPFPTGRVRGMVAVLPNSPTVRVDWPGFWPPATTKQSHVE